MKRWLIIIFSFLSLSVSADVVFSGLDLSPSDQLLFSAETRGPVHGSYRTLFSADVGSQSFYQLTFFPERAVLLENGKRLQIQNRFGIFRTDENMGSMKVVDEFPSFVHGSEIQSGKIRNVESSPDGRYLLYYRQSSVSYADLVLFDVENKTQTVISEHTGFSFDDLLAKWSPDSKFFVYVKNGMVSYFSIDQLTGSGIIAENLRSIGEGSINSVNWSSRNDLYYLKRSRVYKILSAEFFTRSMYQSIFEIGDIVGKIPFGFDPNFDRFTISPDGKKILLEKGGRNLFLYYLRSDDYLSIGTVKSLPYLYLPRNTRVKRVIWSDTDIITVLTLELHNGEMVPSVYRIDLIAQEDALIFKQTEDKGVLDISISPDGKTAALLKSDRIELKEYATWTREKIINSVRPLHILWRNSSSLVVAGGYTTTLVDLESGDTQVLLLSQIGDYGFAKDGAVYGTVAGTSYIWNADKASWSPADSVTKNESGNTSESFRVYLEKSTLGSYRNLVMLRDIKGYGTKPLFPAPEKNYESFPKSEENLKSSIFSHGSRIRRREVSLVFNCINTVEGLAEILEILSEYDIHATFFLNGEFIRRNPDAVRELSGLDHEIGSLFYTYFNMTDSRYRIDEGFIKRGLGRNEDDYFALTGKELSLLWHAPYYFVNSDILKAAEDMDYRYVGRDIDPLDWVPYGECNGVNLYKSSRDIIEDVLEAKKPGSIIPVRVGEVEKGRKDYLFQNLDLLINGLIVKGYAIVPVTVLMEHAK